MKSKIYYFFLLVAVSFCNIVLAQDNTVVSSYFCDFEDVSEYDNWEVNSGPKGPRCINKWYFGKPGANEGEAGLFISGYEGRNADYTNSNATIISYRKLTLEAGVYDFAFDWRAGGTSYSDGLYVCWIPEKDNIKINSTDNGILHNWVDDYALKFGRDSICLNQHYWNTIADTIVSDGSAYFLVFIWANGSLSPYTPGACVDNIMIMKRGLCSRPYDFKINPHGNKVVLSWDGDASAYDVKIYNYITEEWFEYNDIQNKYLEVQGLEEGMMSFYVRSVCDSIKSAWTSRDKFFYYPAARCVDFLNLSSSNCYTGTHLAPNQKKEYVDYGCRSAMSRHTIHWDKTETDPRTEGRLKTVPDGELASVRLGNHRVGAEGEAIEYNLLVDTLSSAVLLLNYAVVMEDPGHELSAQPRFQLHVLNGTRKLDVNGCGEADFSAGFGTTEEDGWVPFKGGSGWWKDWTTVAIDLRQHHGKSLTIRFSTNDCGQTGHYGYAYFTLSCTDGKIEGLTCGGGGSTSGKTEFMAPEGFNYRWYNPNAPLFTLSTDRKFMIEPDDTATYYVDVIQPTNEKCYFTEHVSGVGRFPRAKAAYEFDITNCENYVRFENQSFVQLVNQITNDSSETANKCDEFFWDFGDGDTSIVEHPTHKYPDEGGTYTVRLRAKLIDCDNETSFTITLPKLGITQDTTHEVICKSEYYVFNNDTLYETGIYVDSLKNIYGCDSLVYLDLYVAEKFDTVMYDTICAGEEYYFRGKLLSESGVYGDTTQSPYGCDSIFTMYFEVIEPLDISLVEEAISGCEDDEKLDVKFEFASGARTPVEYSIYFDNQAISAGFVNQERLSFEDAGGDFSVLLPNGGCTPNRYTATFVFYDTTFICSDVSIPVDFDIYYSSSILQAKFGNLIVVLDKGYDFVDGKYEWYVNGVMDSTATGAFYYLLDGETFGEDDCFYMIAVRGSDGTKMQTCEFCPGVYTAIDDIYNSDAMLHATIFDKGQTILSDIDNGFVNIYSLSGVLLNAYDLGTVEVNVPREEGLYILQIVHKDRSYIHKIWVK